MLTALSCAKKSVRRREGRLRFWMDRALALRTRIEADYTSMKQERDAILEILPELRRFLELQDRLFQGLTEEEELEARSLELDIFKFNPSKKEAWRLFERLTKNMTLTRNVLQQCDDYLKALRLQAFVANKSTAVPDSRKHERVKVRKPTDTTADLRRHIARKIAKTHGHKRGRELDKLTCDELH